MRNSFIIALVIATSIGSVVQAETYICKVKTDRRDKGWISKTIAINIDNKTNVVLVSDEIILKFFKKPIQGRLLKTSEKHVMVEWEIRGARDARNWKVPRFTYLATVFKEQNEILVLATPYGNSKSFVSSGKCQIRK